jgi:ABC-type Mn2+/Zn2+ transport system permease subunit
MTICGRRDDNPSKNRIIREDQRFETVLKALYKCGEAILVPDSLPNSRRWTVIASALLCCGLGLVVIYTRRSAFFSPLAVVVVAAIGLAALLLQLRYYNREHGNPIQAPVWLNIVGVLFALSALFADFLSLSGQIAEVMALGAVGSFAISSAMILHAFRKHRATSK